MKHSHLAALLLTGGLLAGCSDSLQSPDEMKSNEYVKQFIEDFGIPAEGHDFSMATSAGLKIKTSRAERIIVSAEIDGNEYEFANLTVKPGINPLPVTIPSTVSTLNIYVGFDKYSVGVNQIFDLDNPGSPVRSRDGYTWNSTDRTFEINTDGNPIIAFKYGDFLKAYFTKYPEGTDNTKMTGQSNYWDYFGLYQYYGDETYYDKNTGKEKKLNFCYCETAFGDTKNTSEDETLISFDIFPVYWRTSEDGKNYGFRFTDAIHPDSHMPISFGGTTNNPFPKLGYSSTVSSVDEIDFKNLSKDFTFDNGTFVNAYNDPAKNFNDNMMIVSEGITITVPKNQVTALFNLDLLTYLNGSTTEYTVSSSGPYLNSRYWGDNYFQTKLSDLVTCAGSTKRTMLDKHLLEGLKYNKNTTESARAYTLSIYDPKDDEVKSRYHGVLPFLLGFNTPAKSQDDASIRDYANVVFLVVPRSKTSVFGRVTTKKFHKFYWTIAAEDLGGSFDWDFNDAVFSFWEVIEDLNTNNNNYERTVLWGPKDAVPVRLINIWANAAGGTMPLYVTYTGKVYPSGGLSVPSSDTRNTYSYLNNQIREKLENEDREGTWVIGTEIHKWLARDTYTEIYNTGATRDVIHDTPSDATTPQHKALSPIQIRVPIDFSPSNYNNLNQTEKPSMSSPNSPLLGFAVLVDKNDELQIETDNGYNNGYGIASLEGYRLGEGSYFIGRPDYSQNDIAPRLLLIPGGVCDDGKALTSAQSSMWEWPRECVNIKEAYPDFVEWVKTPNFNWRKNKDRSKVTQNPSWKPEDDDNFYWE